MSPLRILGRRGAFLFAVVTALLASVGVLPAEETLALRARSQVETSPGSGRFHALTKDVAWDARKTAVVICDMWNQHWCRGATERVGEMAPRMNAVAKAARARGALIIHCPSDTLEFYKDTPQRQLAMHAPHVETKPHRYTREPLPKVTIDSHEHGIAWRKEIDNCRLPARRSGRGPDQHVAACPVRLSRHR